MKTVDTKLQSTYDAIIISRMEVVSVARRRLREAEKAYQSAKEHYEKVKVQLDDARNWVEYQDVRLSR